jgi:hypothetical protein
MPSAAFAGSFLNSFIDEQLKERDRRDTNTRDVINFLVGSGRVRDYNDLLPMMGTLFPGLAQKQGKGGGGKPGGGKGQQQQDPNSILAQWLNPAFKMATEGATAGQRATGSGPLLSDAEVQQRADVGEQHKSDIQFGNFQREEKVRQAGAMELEGARAASSLAVENARVAGRAIKWTPGTTPGSALPRGAFDIYGQPLDPSKHYRQGEDGSGALQFAPAESPKDTGPLAERTRENVALGMTPDRAQQVAAIQIDQERRTKQTQAAGRYGASMAMSRQALLTNTERYTEMKETFPYSLAAKMSGAEAASFKPELIQRQLERGDVTLKTAEERLSQLQAGRADTEALRKARLALAQAKVTAAKSASDAQKEASKIVEAATKQAHVLWGKQGSLVTILGVAPGSEDEIRRNLIQEMSGGLDAADVEELASSRIAAPAAPAATTPTLPPGWSVEPAPTAAPAR